MKVENMTSARGNKVANQFILSDDSTEVFQSYETIIAKKSSEIHPEGNKIQVYLDEKAWNYSVTTGKYRNQFLGETKAETLKKIKSGEYILTNLNA